MKFKYSALNKSGSMESGVIEGDAEATVKLELKSRGLFLVSLKELSRFVEKKKVFFSFGVKHRLPIQLARQLSSLLKGGVPLFQALTIIANQQTGEKERAIIGYLRDQVREGSSLSNALKAYPDIFDSLFIYSVQAGEKSGALDSILTYQAELLENRAVVKGKIKAALIYPAIMAVVGTGVLLFLIGYVVPMVIKIFERMNQQLPLPTKMLISVTAFINHYLFVFVILFALAAYLIVNWIRKDLKAKRMWHNFLLNAPVFGSLYQMILINRFTQVMGTLLKSGVPMLQSLVVVSGIMKNTIAAEAVIRMSELVEGGSALSAAIRDTGVFSSYVADMVAVGESSGNLEEMLRNVSEYYEVNINQRISAFTALVEPVIILVMGAIIAFVLVSILLPLFEMNKLLLKK